MLQTAHRKFEDYPIGLPFAAGTVADVVDSTIVGIQKGDALFWDASSSTCKPACAFAWDTSLEVTRRNFASCFVGFAQDAVSRYEIAADKVKVTGGIFEVPCVSSTYKIGDWLTLDQGVNSAGADVNKLARSKFEKTTDPYVALVEVVQPAASATTTVMVRIVAGLSIIHGARLIDRISEVVFHTRDVTGDAVTGYQFDRKVGLVNAYAITEVATDSQKVYTFSINGGANLTPTITIPVNAQGAIVAASAAFDPTASANIMEHNDVIDIQDDGAGANFVGEIHLRVINL